MVEEGLNLAKELQGKNVKIWDGKAAEPSWTASGSVLSWYLTFTYLLDILVDLIGRQISICISRVYYRVVFSCYLTAL